ncbi:hypothetical protein F5Y09DRAFT_311426 [Xylaria sp. FL1042]|nr:hypothetical protein F5Y09DRAFT_311426 [Xylaria sp. FL1042]
MLLLFLHTGKISHFRILSRLGVLFFLALTIIASSRLYLTDRKNKMPSYPGFGLSLRYLPEEFGDIYPTGHHSDCLISKSPLMQVREVAMMHIMDRLTDKIDWHKKVFDDEIVAQWRAEALAYPDEVLWKLAANNTDDPSIVPTRGIMSGNAFDYCIQELRGKAHHFADTGIVPTLDAAIAVVAKSDTLIPPDLTNALRKGFDRLMRDQADSLDWHPRTDEKVLNLVHPSMYPLVFKSTKVLQDEVVGVADAVDKWAGKGAVICDQPESDSWTDVPLEYWSDDYQWLPSNVTLHDDGSVRFTSYINNLHPTKYPEIYVAIEKLVEKALPMWDQCLWSVTDYEEKKRPGRDNPRFSIPEDPGDDNEENWIPPSWEALRTVNPDPAAAKASENLDWKETERLQRRWREIRQPALHEPKPFEEVKYSPHHRLLERFKDTGLQVIVKMVSIELTPEKPSYPAGSWHVEGQMNEHICGTALYYLDSENVSTSHLSFRMPTDPELSNEPEYFVEQGRYSWLQKVFGTQFGGFRDGTCLQNYGNVETPEGRLLAFPNVFQHCVSPFHLVDPTKPGHRRFIALWLVDPYIRIISTANVPPQQQDWWVESVFGRSAESQQAAVDKFPAELAQVLEEKGLIGKARPNRTNGKLPVKLVDMVRSYFDESPGMSDEEARGHRLKLMDERTVFIEEANWEWQNHNYNFCEH